MQFFRGAVNAISAPYQYYKDLPPINPATLTGAIDVIVIQRPTDSGDSELVCSPFHVRFGKWQVLRPGEKKVTVSVNGRPIPFDMKIGEAGEAFFVFETEDDVPADLITSPILHPTTPANDADVDIDSFGTRRKDGEEKIGAAQEPEFLDLNALPSDENDRAHTLQPQSESVPQKHDPSGFKSSPADSLPSPPPSPTAPSLLARTGTKMDPAETPQGQIDEAVRAVEENVHVPKVEYHHDVALDMAGYHASAAHGREVSEQTITPDDGYESPQPSASTSHSFTEHAHPELQTPKPRPFPKLLTSKSRTAPPPTPQTSVPFPIARATSEPPPDDEDAQGQSQQQEYSWEWGAFPQPSPMKTTFGSFGSATVRGKAKERERLPAVDSDDDGEERAIEEVTMHRSQSVPPELEGSPAALRRELPLAVEDAEAEVQNEGEESGFGAGGRLRVDRRNPTRFRVRIEGRIADFELSLVDDGGDGERGRRGSRGVDADSRDHEKKSGKKRGVFDGRNEVEAAQVFERGKVSYSHFLEDDRIVRDAELVIRWAGEQYITRADGSPLMDALVLWRDAALRARSQGLLTPRSSSPSPSPAGSSEEEEHSSEGEEHARAQSVPPEPPQPMRKPTSSSWVRWWSRSREEAAEGKGGRPTLRESASEPLDGVAKAKKTDADASSVPFPQVAARNPEPMETMVLDGAVAEKRKKYAKTLRLSSDQLKSLNLKSGANTITFSLSASGVVACTARIFVWDSTDLVVVSDIDGTITKSDGLGHVFAMIGRDWTHLGVAKLYTDITRNGYKIMYLTSRAIGQADATRDYLKGIKQNDYQLPEGPVIMSPDRLMASLHREVIMRKPEVFKMACLRDIQRLFGEASRNPFYAGFGNRITDALSYRSVNVPSARIFTIDSTGEVKMELLELAGYKSSYIHMTDLVDQMFPPIHRKWAPEFTDFNYWKAPVREFPLPDLSPPSPALSARSDTSNQSTLARLRNFSLVGSRQSQNGKRFSLPPPATERSTADQGQRRSQLREISSFERLSSTLAQFTQSGDSRRSLSPDSRASSSSTYLDSGSEDEYGDEGDSELAAKRRRRRERRTSMESMPGSLPGTEDDMHFGLDEAEDGDVEERYEGDEHTGADDEEEAAEEAFDEDFLAAGEMENVPFL